MKNYLQRMGRSIQLPVSVLPAAALLVGIGHWLPQKSAVAQFLQSGGNAILNNLAILFAVGLALGMSKDKDGASALAGLVAYLVPSFVLAPKQVADLFKIKESAVDPAFAAIPNNVFIGIIGGLIAAAMYNRFHNTKLPMALSFFSGKRSVPIVTSVVMLLVSVLLLFVWPPVYTALIIFGKFIVGLGAIGAGLFGFFNRLLIPTGLHHALNQVFWFNAAGINDIGNFWASKGTKGVTGMYLAGFFPVMMFGLPAGAYAMYRNALPERKKETASLLLAGAFASFFTGVTEPLEFSFMFVAWPLYVLHAVLMGLSMWFAALMHWTAGFTFSGGLVDYVLSLRVPIANMPLMLLVQGLIFAAIYFFTFDFAIKKFNLMTPGREPIEVDEAMAIDFDEDDDKFMITAKKVYAGLGGYKNIKVVDNCTTRLRMQLVDSSTIDIPLLKSASAGVNVLDKTNVHIVIGTEVQFVADALSKLFEAKAPISKVESSNDIKEDTENVVSNGAITLLNSVSSGRLEKLEDVPDQTFSQKMLGDGFAIIPDEDKVYSPVDGVITSIFPTKHAFGITTDSGLEILIHIGIDTVNLSGEPFDVVAQEGQQVKSGDLLVNVDFDAIKAADKKTDTIVIITNMDLVAELDFSDASGSVDKETKILKVTNK
ncbi:N-acetylglucosamine-specific PTS transporter subunit IIBC [Companilactobacillus metriopterae]|uniref:N-acetylglucosamine-specific PTS transporter subunit IIBC n=1 Tax=Companilactobacillus metriopterae TaxID=1909267 RepID=UPI00100AE02F|nr:N-acetylglucosamine-specific PTS transporter subunit IIBC [Companilactobacillus metriopterae]